MSTPVCELAAEANEINEQHTQNAPLLGLNSEAGRKVILIIKTGDEKSPTHRTSQWEKRDKEGRIRSGWEIKECKERSFKNKNERKKNKRQTTGRNMEGKVKAMNADRARMGDLRTT